MTNERIQLVAITLMLEGNMCHFGHILRSHAKGLLWIDHSSWFKVDLQDQPAVTISTSSQIN